MPRSVSKQKQIRKNWLGYAFFSWIDVLDYKRLSGPWTVEEDEAVLVGVRIFTRHSYSRIAYLVPGRNTSDVKARIRIFIRRKILVSALHFFARVLTDELKAERNNTPITRPDGFQPSGVTTQVKREEVSAS